MSVRDVVGRPELRLGLVHEGDLDAAVRWVATSELAEPGPFLEGGEVLLTTGLNTRGWTWRWDGYVEHLLAAGAVALGLALGLTHDRVPEALRAACRRRGLTLFEVPRETAFVSVSRAAADLLESERGEADREAWAMQRELTRAAQRGEPEPILAGLATILDGAAVLLRADGEVEVPPAGELATEDLLALGREVRRLRPRGLRASSSASSQEGTTLVQPLGVRGSPETYLAVRTPGRLEEGPRSAVTAAVALLSLLGERRTEQRAQSRRLRGRAADVLLEGDVRSAAVLLSVEGGVPPDRVELPSWVRLVAAVGEDLDGARTVLEDRLASPGRPALVTRRGEELWVVARPREVPTVTGVLTGEGLRAGVGPRVPLGEATGSREATSRALVVTSEAQPVVVWDDLAGRGVQHLLDERAVASFARSVLGSVVEDPVAVETLRSFLRHHGSRAEVASELGIHRNTVRNRLGQIEATTGRSLDDPQVRVDAWVALSAVPATPEG
ncbi:MAG: helix-turn-helix domain-containing protein [Georgenia sp.]